MSDINQLLEHLTILATLIALPSSFFLYYKAIASQISLEKYSHKTRILEIEKKIQWEKFSTLSPIILNILQFKLEDFSEIGNRTLILQATSLASGNLSELLSNAIRDGAFVDNMDIHSWKEEIKSEFINSAKSLENNGLET